jgi:DnaJ-domain-containing protein 1
MDLYLSRITELHFVKQPGKTRMRISWSELLIIMLILFFASGTLRPIMRKAILIFMKAFKDFDEPTRAGRSSTSKSSNNSQQYKHNGKEASPTSIREERDPYKILNIDHSASQEEILSAYRKLAQMYHPDKVAGLAPEYREIAERKMKIINGAYQKVRK